ncbi:CbbQ/NirQ/NorQ/GpvN family protein [Lutibacter aestuarii]|uniref:CbbQ/NirQ/NorQ/GpvN family protein n=1 Tax=Lutibacter aestuarii TaxID=861111 RepID=A0ABW2Z7H8_9FLAO
MKNQSPYYKAIGKEVEVFEQTYASKIPFLLKGPTGTGKSRFIEFIAHKLNKKLITISCHEETSSTDLIGRYIIKGAETVWLDGPLTTAVKEGAIIYLDEIAEARPDVIVAIHSLTDHRRELFIDKLGETIKAHEDFMLVASFNPGYQKGFKELKPSTRQRFIAVSFAYPKATLEAEILVNETGIDANTAKKLVNIATKIRNLTELGLTETVSTRLLVDAAKLIHNGLPKRLSVEVAIVEPLTDDLEVIEALKDLCNLMI